MPLKMKKTGNHIFSFRGLISPGWTYSDLPKIYLNRKTSLPFCIARIKSRPVYMIYDDFSIKELMLARKALNTAYLCDI
jgi:hypothetical protein